MREPVENAAERCADRRLLDEWAAERAPGSDWFVLCGPSRALSPAVRPEGSGGDDAWLRCADQLDSLAAWVDRTGDWLQRTAGRRLHRSVATTYVTGWYLDVLARTAAGWFGEAGVLPELTPEQTWLRRDLWPQASAIGERFACEPTHPFADSASLRSSRAALLGTLRHRVRAHAALFFGALGDGVPASSRQRWGMLDDLLGVALVQAGTRAGDRFRGLDDAARVTGSSGGVLRRSCCFAVQVDPALECTRCPRRARG